MIRSFSAALAALVCICAPIVVRAESLQLTGVVVDANRAPIAGATVHVTGQGIDRSTQSDSAGRFAFTTLTAGEYVLSAQKGALHADAVADLGAGGTNVTLTLAPLKEIAHGITVRATASGRAGTDVGITAATLAKTPGTGSMSGILAQLPAAAVGSNGQIHINGDHNGLNYYLDGVQLPASLNRVLGSEIDPSTIGYVDALEGAYPAQYGDKFAAVLNIGTRTFSGPAGVTFEGSAGSFGTNDATLGYHRRVGAGGSLTLALRADRSDRGIDPPQPQYTHDGSSGINTLARLILPVHGADTLSLDIVHSLSTFQVPPDTANGVPATTDDNELQNDTFSSLQYRHAIGDRGVFSFGPSVKISRILDTNDPNNDLAGAAGSSCTDFSDCAFFSAFGDRIARDYRFTTDYDLRSPHHDVRAGATYGITRVTKSYAITLQPNNALNPSGGTFSAYDNEPNDARTIEAYVQDGWQLGPHYRLDYGLRSDSFTIRSSEFANGFAQLSPRIKLTRTFSPRASLYVYYGRLFEPFSFENIAPSTAQSLYATNSGQSFDLRPQRDSLYEVGGHLPLGAWDLGVRVSHKVSTDYLDDTQVGATNLHQDINFPQGRVDVQTLYAQRTLPREGRAFLSLTHSTALNSENCETQLLQNCAASGVPGGQFVASDHDQRWEASSGILVNDRRGGWFSLNGEYGSGLSRDPGLCDDNVFNCKVPPHLTFDAQKGFLLTRNLTFSISVENLLNDRYAITLNNALQGTHYARPRSITFSVGVK